MSVHASRDVPRPAAERPIRALIAGAAGFIGSHLTERLLAEGWQVVGIDNFATGRRGNLAACLDYEGFEFIEGDVISPVSVDGPLDWIFHMASPASPPRYLAMPLQTLLVNSAGTKHLLDLALEKQAQFLFASTSEIYGDPLVHPQPESYWGNVNTIGPRSVYDEAKRFAEALVMSYHRERGLPIRLIRIFNTYGPRMDPEDGRVVSNLICQTLRGEPITIYGDGSQTRSFQFIDDLIEGIFRLTQVPFYGPVNLGNPDEYTILGLARLIQEEIGVHLAFEYRNLPEDDPKQRRPDITRAKALLGWEPLVDVRTGLSRSIEYFRSELQRATLQPDNAENIVTITSAH